MSERRRRNRLAEETSPYLLQHANNPVDWYPWGPEALRRAQELDRPILLSIGYSACHWCHVMERESFENEAIARLMNEHFVCVKVDREERPDLDDIYMAATVALSGSGGWPMTVFLTPTQEPFFAGTYFPPEDRYGRPGFPALLTRVAELWRSDRPTLLEQARQLTEQVRSAARPTPPGPISRDTLRQAYRALARDFDPVFGGFGGAPKFPPSAALSLLLRYHRLSGDEHALLMVRRTLDGMKNGGLYDQLGGGFARYSVDARWLVPHFEKMLYDNAQLADVYLEAYAATGDPEYRRVARETLDYVARDMQGPSGGYFSSSDADSEGEEGKYFVWRLDEVRAVLEDPLAERFCLFFGVTAAGNWEGTNVLHTPHPLAHVARELGVDVAELSESLREARALMLEARQERLAPAVDDKVLVAWNGLMIRAMAHGYRQLGDPRHLASARRAADFVLRELRRPDGGLFRTARSGQAHLDGYLEDYAYFVDGLISLYEVSAAPEYLSAARELGERMVADFAPSRTPSSEASSTTQGGPEPGEGGAFYHTAHSHEPLLTRPREGHDGALPNPNAVACRALGRLAAHLDRDDLRRVALDAALAYGSQVKRQPRAFATLLCAVDFLLEPPLEIVLASDPDSVGAEDLAAAIASAYLPNRIEARASTELAQDPTAPPLVRGKTPVGDRAAVYVCEGFTCRAPVTEPEEVRAALLDTERANRARARQELGRQRIEGRATSAGTLRLTERSGLGAAAYAALPPGVEGALSVSRVGFGGYRVGLDHPDHRAAVREALQRGLNLFDTAPSFALGDSERVLGESLAEAIASGQVARDEIVLVTKAGVAQGPDRERIAQREREGRPYRATGPLAGATDAGPAFCLDPDFLRDQLTGSLERLGVEHVEVCLVQNPEHLLLAAPQDDPEAVARARRELLESLEAAFRHLEEEVAAGRITYYGVSTNVAARPPEDPARIDLDELAAAALRAGGPSHHFRVLELPLNLAEPAALQAAPGQRSPLDVAVAQGWAVLACRPLNALVGDAVVRLAEPEPLKAPPAEAGPAPSAKAPSTKAPSTKAPPAEAPPSRPEPAQGTSAALDGARERVAQLEQEFESRFAPGLRAARVLADEALFSFGGPLGRGVERAASVQQFDHIEGTFVTPRLRDLFVRLERLFADRGSSPRGPDSARTPSDRDAFVDWRNRYIAAIGEWLAATRAHAGQGNRRLLADLEEDLAGRGELALAWGGELGSAPWPQRALALVRGVEGVTSVLVGMRRVAYVSDAVASLRLPVPPGVRHTLARLPATR